MYEKFCFSGFYFLFALVGSLFSLACSVHMYFWHAGFPANIAF
jgi:hypothetical protein